MTGRVGVQQPPGSMGLTMPVLSGHGSPLPLLPCPGGIPANKPCPPQGTHNIQEVRESPAFSELLFKSRRRHSYTLSAEAAGETTHRRRLVSYKP